MNRIPISFPMFGDDFVLNPSRYVEIFGLKIYWYGIIIAFGFLVAFLYLYNRRKDFGLTQDNIADMFIIVIPCSIVGARLYYVIFNSAGYIGAGNWLNIFKIWEGGLAIYGGIIGSIIGLFFYGKAKKIPLLNLLDIASLGVIIGQIFGRWGNFINREAFGKQTDIFCRMGLTYADGTTIYVHPTFLYESLWNLIGFFIIRAVSKKRKFDGHVTCVYLAWYGLGRFFIEGLRTDSLYLFNTGIRVSQLVAVCTFIFGIALLIYKLCIKKCDGSKLYVNSLVSKTNEVLNESENENDINDSDDFINE